MKKSGFFEKKNVKCIVSSKKSNTFASQLTKRPFRAFSSAGSEHLPYKQRVGGSNPSTPTDEVKQVNVWLFLFLLPLLYKLSPSFYLVNQEKELILRSDNYLKTYGT